MLTSCLTPSSKCSSSMSSSRQLASARPVSASMGQAASSNEYVFGLKSHLRGVGAEVAPAWGGCAGARALAVCARDGCSWGHGRTRTRTSTSTVRVRVRVRVRGRGRVRAGARVDGHATERVAVAALLGRGEVHLDHLGLILARQTPPVDRRRLRERAWALQPRRGYGSSGARRC